MKKLGLTVALLVLAVAGFSNVLILEGQYQQKNIYVVNSVGNDGVGFCTYEVRVNGNITTDELQSSAFEIDLGTHALGLGDEVFIEIKYKEGCAPKVLNPGAIRPRPNFKTEEINLSNEGLLTWSTVEERGELPYYVQQYKWNKWVTVGEVQGVGTASMNSYAFQVDLCSGENKFRVMQKGYEREVKYSPVVNVISTTPKVTFTYSKSEKAVIFSAETNFEVYDKYGQLKKKGYGLTIDVGNLSKGEYYVSYDSSVDEFRKK